MAFGSQMLHWCRRNVWTIRLRGKKKRYLGLLGLAVWVLVSGLFLLSLTDSGYSLSTLAWDNLGLQEPRANNQSITSDEKSLGPEDLQRLYRQLHYETDFQYPTSYRLQRDLLTVQMGPLRGQQVPSVDDLPFYDADPRLVWSVLAHHLIQHPSSDARLPFSWYDWADFHDYNKLLSLKKTEVPCDFFFGYEFSSSQLSKIEQEVGEELFEFDRPYYDATRELDSDEHREMLERSVSSCTFDSSSASSKRYSIGAEVTLLQDAVRPEVYRFQARNYMLHNLANPLSLTILNDDQSTWQLLVDQDSRQTLVQSGLVANYLEKLQLAKDQDFTFNSSEEFDKFANSESSESHRVHIEDLDVEESRAFENVFTDLKESDFEFDALAEIQKLETQPTPLNAHHLSYLESLRYSTNTHFAFAPKYFQEPGSLKDFLELGRHHDKRFFNGAIFRDSEETQLRLNSMMRTFQKFLKANGLICWIAHGSLYGYLYNGRTFPWDNDFDMQMPIRHLNILAKNFNQSLILEDPRDGNGRFFLDIGSSITTRIRGNGENNIDARFIDIDSGLYIDITGLSVSTAMMSDKDDAFFSERKDALGHEVKFRDPNLIPNKTDLPLQVLYNKVEGDILYSYEQIKKLKSLITKYNEGFSGDPSPSKFYSAEQRYSLNHELGLYNCRNHHFVHFDMVSPLISTNFHGVAALVPRKYVSLLKREYSVPSKMDIITFNAKTFIPKLGAWMPSSLLKKLLNIKRPREDWEMVKSGLNKLGPSEVGMLSRNAARSKETGFLSNIYNGMDISTYRLKELEIHFSRNHTAANKESLLQQLKSDIGSHLKPHMKDPLIHRLQKRELHKRSQTTESETETYLTINLAIAGEIQGWTEMLDNNTLALYKGTREGSLDFNFESGDVNNINIFETDPPLPDQI
ncbi:LADA_0H18448g1_1 [Lachancea dasiensis]|uniref:LADA_0H18448g1_1 n=1 Tax=Lachancea dasiensis TaxID=1072105 RepID=A0A1G4K5Z2_9SACH|nr:LADA_0H18448g1_1 [Lachancea dasiensis]